jgi:hypothetical protein
VSAFHHDVEPVSLIDAVGTVHTSSSCRWALTLLASGGSVDANYLGDCGH